VVARNKVGLLWEEEEVRYGLDWWENDDGRS
jgi:hypothetical protein